MSLKTAFTHVVEKLREIKTLKAMRILDEGALMVTLSELGFDEDIAIYLLAGELSFEIIKKAVNGNTRSDIHTMFIISDELVGENGMKCQPDKGLRLLLDIYEGKVYAFNTDNGRTTIFPIYVARDGMVTYGETVNLTNLSSDYVAVNSNFIRGVRKIAAFSKREFHQSNSGYRVSPRPYDPLQPYYDVLGIAVTATATEIKVAYRTKARQHHPDADKSPDATAKMQKINEAYEQIMKRFE